MTIRNIYFIIPVTSIYSFENYMGQCVFNHTRLQMVYCISGSIFLKDRVESLKLFDATRYAWIKLIIL